MHTKIVIRRSGGVARDEIVVSSSLLKINDLRVLFPEMIRKEARERADKGQRTDKGGKSGEWSSIGL